MKTSMRWLVSLAAASFASPAHAQTATTVLSGYVFEDVNYGGGPGRARSAAGTTPRPGATVELYDNAQNLAGTTTTDASGQYSFTVAPATYTVRVVNSTVTSSRPGYAPGLLPVQTYNGTTTAVGGEAPALPDAPANSGSETLAALQGASATPQSLAQVVAGSPGPDFGYNFDVVVNTNDEGQGSLRQFILNANALGDESLLTQAGFYTNAVGLATGSGAAGLAGVALPAGVESSIFMVPAAALTTGVAVVTPASALPQLTGANTALNGATQTYNIGNTNDVLLGAGGTVGTTATPLNQLNGPEVQLVGSTSVAIGLSVGGAGSFVRGLAVYGFGDDWDDDSYGNLVLSADNITVVANVLGSAATSFAPPAVANVASNVRVPSGTGDSFTNNLIGFSNSTGIYLAPAVTGTAIVGNEFRGNARVNTVYDGIDSHGSSTTITHNLFADNAAQGFDSYGSAGANKLTGNTFTHNGIGNTSSAPVETATARFYGVGNTFSQNISTGNYGDGVEILTGATVISQNAIYNNGTIPSANGTAAIGQIGIDLLADGENGNAGNFPFVTLNGANTAGGNNLLNYPILRTAHIVGSNLLVTGYAKAGATIELFVAQPNASALNATGAKFGQGKTYLATRTEGVNDGSTSTGQSYGPGTINGFAQGQDTNANGFSFTIPLASLPGGTLAAGTVLTSTATLNGATSEFSGNVTAVAIAPLTGYVYEDVNYGGGAGRSFATLATPALGRAGAKVELYNSNEDLVGTAITNASGQYSFSVPVASGYTVRVVNSTVLSGRAGATATSGSAATGYVSDQLAVQTYNGTATHVGGAHPSLADAAANTGSQTLVALTTSAAAPQSIATTSVGTGTTNAGPDFGFNFDLVVNTNDAGQGSLRQFILNANALGGEATLAQSGFYTNARNLATGNTASGQAGVALPAGTESSIFMVPAAQLTLGVAAITTASELPTITSPSVAINGATQTYNIGNTNDVLLGAGGTVGTAATPLSQLNGPEVQLAGSRTGTGIELAAGATNATVRGLSIYGYGSQVGVGADLTGTLIEQNVLGTTARSFSDPGAGVRGTEEGIMLYNSDSGLVRHNLIGYNGGMGIWVYGDGNGANNNVISNNELRGNAQEVLVGTYPTEGLVYDNMELQGASTGNLVTGNLITEGIGNGIDSYFDDMGGNTITGNTISNNGQGIVSGTGVEGSGLRVYGATNPTTISHNVLSGNNGSGVLVMAGADKVLISQNATFDNTRLGIDLLTTSEGNDSATMYNGATGTATNVTRNSNGSDTGGNGLLNFPVIATAKIQGSSLLVTGYARPGATLELFIAGGANGVAANAGFGQGRTYLGTVTEGAANDTDPTTGSYAGPINGRDQGSDTTNKFAFEISLAGPYAGVAPGTVLTSTATLGGVTSEFSGTVAVTSAPLPVVLVSFMAQPGHNRTALLNWTTASELRNHHFELERSLDGVAFTKLAKLTGRGTTAAASNYTYTDANLATATTAYYRLRQVDTDGSATYSPVRSVRFAAEETPLAFDLAPNPATSTVALDLTQLPAGTYRLCVLDLAGRVLREQQLAAGLTHTLPLAELPSGTYLVRVSSEALSFTKRLNKE